MSFGLSASRVVYAVKKEMATEKLITALLLALIPLAAIAKPMGGKFEGLHLNAIWKGEPPSVSQFSLRRD